ncbi:MAG: tRNA (guanosine(37)-N1)-methyltransferase TrmD [Lachnospiraceae bacterium]|nr:tRNA (guanosine(37)-N1)-methyltransferase TrmD [Lachnospiraceae bacterium]
MKFTVLTLFPEFIENSMHTSICKRAIENGYLELETCNFREYTENKNGRVDDYPYGGGAGMLIQAQPVYDAYMAVTGGRKVRTIYLTPQGEVFNQAKAHELAEEEELVFLCGHYEGIDERVLEEIVTDNISIGDYVLTGGEIASVVVMDAISRLIPGVLGNHDSADTESFENGLLEYPQYTRPEIWRDKRVPEVLLSGHHANIEKWRQEQSLLRTKERRPDLLDGQ